MKKVLIGIVCMLVLLTGCQSESVQYIEKEEKTISIRKMMQTGSYAIDSGCYYVNNQGYLYFFDYATEESVIVCPRPDCSIEESSESYIAGASYFVYKDRLYVIKRDLSDSNFVRGLLIESDLDRGNRKEIASLPSYDILSFAQYGNKVYFAIDEQKMELDKETGNIQNADKSLCYLYSVNLDTKEGTKTSLCMEDYNNSIEIVCSDDNSKLLVKYSYFEHKYDGTNFEASKNHTEYYEYDLNDDTYQLLDKKSISEHMISDAMYSNDGNRLFTIEKDQTTSEINVISCDLKNDTAEILDQTKSYPIVLDSWYFSQDNDEWQQLSSEGVVKPFKGRFREDLKVLEAVGEYFICITVGKEAENLVFIKQDDYFKGNNQYIDFVSGE